MKRALHLLSESIEELVQTVTTGDSNARSSDQLVLLIQTCLHRQEELKPDDSAEKQCQWRTQHTNDTMI